MVFAGGGNRCYWQGGFYEAAAERLGLTPQLVVGASAGAFSATYSLLGLGPEVRHSVIGACGPHLKNFDFVAWRQGKPLCPVGPMYQELLDLTVDAGALARINALTDFQIAYSRLPRRLSPRLGAALGIGAYQLEKQLFHPVHPRFGRALGFRGGFVSARKLADPQLMREALIASGGIPPFMPVTLIDGEPASTEGWSTTCPSSRCCLSKQAAVRRWCCSLVATKICRRSQTGPTCSLRKKSTSASSTSRIPTASAMPSNLD